MRENRMHIESERMKNTRRSISIEQEQREGVYDCRQIGTFGRKSRLSDRPSVPSGMMITLSVIQDLTFRRDCVTDEQVTIASTR